MTPDGIFIDLVIVKLSEIKYQRQIMLYQETKINLSGLTIACKTWNPNRSNPVLCLHGKMDNAASFDLLAPLLTDTTLVAVDFPGTGYSTHYQAGVIPHWKNDAFLLLQMINALEWKEFDIVGHSLGHLIATLIAIAKPNQVKKLVFLDILGPKYDFIEENIRFLERDVETYLTYHKQYPTVFPDLKSAIQDRMKIGNISYQAAEALVKRGTRQSDNGWVWTFDRRLRCVGSTIPHEDELHSMFTAINAPVCLIRARQGLTYPEDIFKKRAAAIKNMTIYEVDGGHHVHMDNPVPVAKMITKFLSEQEKMME